MSHAWETDFETVEHDPVTSLQGLNKGENGGNSPFFPLLQPLKSSLRPIGDEAFVGLAGEVVDALSPHTEASRVGLLVSLLTMFGNAVGPRPHYQVGAERHRPNLFAVLIGPSGTGRKGMAISEAERLVGMADADWRDRVVRGLVSGEGVIWHVRDARVELDSETGDEKIVEQGVRDKRLLVREDELAAVLAAMSRDGSTLSAVLRDAWDGRRLQTLAKHHPAKASGAHISVLAGITPEEALRKLTATEQANGFANRFLWVYTRRENELPDGGTVDATVLGELATQIGAALAKARALDGVLRDDDARELWHVAYPRLTRDVPGMTGAMRSRAEAQVLRLSLCYALLDGQRLIRREHVQAALELWEYAERSLRKVFGDRTGDPHVDRIIAALRAEPNGLTRTQINDLFGGRVLANQLEQALRLLSGAGLAYGESEETAGRPIQRWHAVRDDQGDEGGEQ